MSVNIGSGYGSEFHLMRYMARYRNYLDSMVEKETGGKVIEWLDFASGNDEEYNLANPTKIKLPDHEIVGIDFLKNERLDLVMKWKSFWPQTGNQQNWDAVGRMEIDGIENWLLIEAKAHIEEIKSDCGAKEPALSKINSALKTAFDHFGLLPNHDLKKGYYQYANRIAVLYFLRENGIPAKLLFIYFIGDKNPYKLDKCPKSKEEWKESLRAQNEWLGLDPEKKKEIGIYELFLHVVPTKVEKTGQLL
jgi:hypothetical protein